MLAGKKVVFLDKDGTIIPDVPYNVDPNLISLNEGVIEGLKLLQKNNFYFVIISNQAGVARGYFKIEELNQVKQKLNELLNKEGINLEAFYFCPHHTEGTVEEYAIKCSCRKPEPGMLLKAAEELEIDLKRAWMVGDILNDVEAGNRAGCQTILVQNGNEDQWVSGPFRKPTFIAGNFLEAASYIVNHPHKD